MASLQKIKNNQIEYYVKQLESKQLSKAVELKQHLVMTTKTKGLNDPPLSRKRPEFKTTAFSREAPLEGKLPTIPRFP